MCPVEEGLACQLTPVHGNHCRKAKPHLDRCVAESKSGHGQCHCASKLDIAVSALFSQCLSTPRENSLQRGVGLMHGLSRRGIYRALPLFIIFTMFLLVCRRLVPITHLLAPHSTCPTRPLATSRQWIERHIRDKYVKEARYQSYRARSAFKLVQIDDKYRLIKPGMIVVECGAAPGSWTQVLVQRLRLAPPNPYKTGALLAVDIANFAPVEGAICLPKTDFTSPLSQAKILNALNDRKVDLIVSDMSPNVTGQHELDHERILQLVYSTLQFAIVCLKQDGNFLVKIFHGTHTDELVNHLTQLFGVVKRVKPDASRGDSTELYLLAMQFKKIPPI